MAMAKLVNFFTCATGSFMAFVRSGYVNLNNGQARNVGENGYGWSRTAKSSIYGYNLNMNTTDVNPSNNNNRYNGFPLRWVARAVPIFEYVWR